MTDDFDFYDLLEIDEDATQEEVKDAFREKVREYHPDLNDHPSAPAQFTAVKKGYEILKDPAERQAYDRLGHIDYVAKRTSGIPDPDAWRTDDKGSSRSSGSASGPASGSAGTESASTGSTGAGSSSDGSSSGRSSRSSSRSSSSRSSSSSDRSSTSASNRRSRSSSSASNRRSSSRSSSSSSRSSSSSSRSGSSSSRGESSNATSSSSRSSQRRASTSSTGTSSNRRARSSTSSSSTNQTPPGASATGTGGQTADTDSTIGTRSSPSTSSWTDNALFNWWRSLRLGWPLMLTATILFVAGVGYWAYANLDAFRAFANALTDAGSDTAALQAALVERHGIPTLYAFVDGTMLVEPQLPTRQWYGALAGAVALTVFAFGVYRAVWAKRPYKWVTMNETVGVGLVTAAATTILGGPLLAGAVVMPFVFLVIIRHTRAAYKFKPTYGYVLGVSVPLAAIAAEYVIASPPLALDLVAVVVPVLTVLVLLFSAFVRPKLFN